MSLPFFSFAVYPTALDGSFDAFVLEVPDTSGHDAAARRAWWQTFHLLGPRGYEPEQFTVCELLEGDVLGRVVSSGGLTDLTHTAAGVAPLDKETN